MSRRAGEVFRVAAIAANSHPNSINSVQIRFLSCYNESTNRETFPAQMRHSDCARAIIEE